LSGSNQTNGHKSFSTPRFRRGMISNFSEQGSRV
jgi:hypothetical protein